MGFPQGQRELSVITGYLYQAGVHKAGLDCIALVIQRESIWITQGKSNFIRCEFMTYAPIIIHLLRGTLGKGEDFIKFSIKSGNFAVLEGGIER